MLLLAVARADANDDEDDDGKDDHHKYLKKYVQIL